MAARSPRRTLMAQGMGLILITCYGVPWKCRVLGFKDEGFTFSIFRVSGFRLWHLEERQAMKQAPV